MLDKHRRYNANSLTLMLALSLSAFAVAADAVKVGGTGSAVASIQHLAASFEHSRPQTKVITIEALGSSGSIKAVAAGVLDISLSARPLKAAEYALHLTQKEIARTPLVLASARMHDTWNVNDIPAIFDGSLSTWPDNMPLRPVLRPGSDTEITLLRAISPAIDRALSAAYKRPGVHIAITDQDCADALEKIPGAVGVSTLALIRSERRKLHALPLGGVTPSPHNLAQGHYPYYKPLYLIVPPKRSESAQAFMDFILSKRGAKILSDNGYLLIP